jgi:hypothetical protein
LPRRSNAVTISPRLHYCETDCARRSDWIDVPWVKSAVLSAGHADTVILWPFASKDGPMGKEPAMLAPLQARVTQVACHLKSWCAGTAASRSRRWAWNAKGTMLAFAAEDGDAGLLEL